MQPASPLVALPQHDAVRDVYAQRHVEDAPRERHRLAGLHARQAVHGYVLAVPHRALVGRDRVAPRKHAGGEAVRGGVGIRRGIRRGVEATRAFPGGVRPSRERAFAETPGSRPHVSVRGEGREAPRDVRARAVRRRRRVRRRSRRIGLTARGGEIASRDRRGGRRGGRRGDARRPVRARRQARDAFQRAPHRHGDPRTTSTCVRSASVSDAWGTNPKRLVRVVVRSGVVARAMMRAGGRNINNRQMRNTRAARDDISFSERRV